MSRKGSTWSSQAARQVVAQVLPAIADVDAGELQRASSDTALIWSCV